MHHHGHRHGRGFSRRLGRFNRENFIPRLEEYQKDLEQELADVADLLRRLKEGASGTTQTA